MGTTFTIKEDNAGLWCVCCDSVVLAERLGLTAAFEDGCGRAHDHHQSTGDTAVLELSVGGRGSVIDVYDCGSPPDA